MHDVYKRRENGRVENYSKLLVPLVGLIIIPAESRYLKFFNKFIFKTFI